MNGPAAQQYWDNKLPEMTQLHTELDLKAMEQDLSESMPG